jgi:hypothetical protein
MDRLQARNPPEKHGKNPTNSSWQLTVAPPKVRDCSYKPFVELRGPSQPLLWNWSELGPSDSSAWLLSGGTFFFPGGVHRVGWWGERLHDVRAGGVLEMPRGGEHVGGNWRLHRREERLLELRKNRKGVLLE